MRCLFAPILLVLAPLATAGDTVVPGAALTTAGTGAYSTLLNSGARSYQLVVGPQELGGLPVGSSVSGITWRRPTWIAYADWPGTGFTCNWTNYDIFLSSSLNPPGSLSTSYLDNIGPDVQQVRSGPLSLVNVHFPGGALTPATNPFGQTIQFQTPYVYQGGDLLLTIRHTGNDCGGSGGLDTVGSTFTQAIGQSSYTDPDNWYSQGLIVMRLEFDPPSPGTETCTGDGGDQVGCTNCPCGNNAPVGSGGGCINSSGSGTRLIASGSTSVTLPTGDTTDLRFALSGAPASAFCILNSGDNVAPQGMANPCFGLGSGTQASTFDGLRCAVQNTLRHGGRSADINGEVGVTNNPWGGEGGPPVGLAVAGLGFSAGQTRYFQVIHRDDPLAVCTRGLNTTQAVEVTFTP